MLDSINCLDVGPGLNVSAGSIAKAANVAAWVTAVVNDSNKTSSVSVFKLRTRPGGDAHPFVGKAYYSRRLPVLS